ncbi:MAG: TolC family protein [Vampirovibrionales bacterium]
MNPIFLIRYMLMLAIITTTLHTEAMAFTWFKRPHTSKISQFFHPVPLSKKQVRVNIPNTYTPATSVEAPAKELPLSPENPQANAALINWRTFFADDYLSTFIDTALANNQELKIFEQDVQIARNEVQEKQGEYLPKVGLGFGLGHRKNSEHTDEGLQEKLFEKNELRSRSLNLDVGANFSWEVDIWRKLRNAKDAASMRLLAQQEGRYFLVARLVAEIARTYYELMALDNSLKILDQNITVQSAACHKMQLLKQYARANQLAVNRFQAQLLDTKTQRFELKQQIVETENRLRFLTGVYEERPILRHSERFMTLPVAVLQTGVPAQLLENRPDIRQAMFAIQATKLDLKSVQAQLYPSVGIKAGIGFSAFDPTFLFNPTSLVYNALGEIMTPLINRKAILARIRTTDATQVQAIFAYEQTLLQAYTDVLNQLAKTKNMQQSLALKQKEVALLNESVEIANSLFRYAKADYVEVLLTQEERLVAQKELVSIKMELMGTRIALYRTLGGGWQ